MALTKREKEMLERLQAKAEEPDRGPISRALNVSIDLGDAKQVALAKRYGFLDDDDDDLDDEGTDDKGGKNGDEGDDTPKRKGYFGE